MKEYTYGGISDVKLMVKSGADKFDIFSSGAGGCDPCCNRAVLFLCPVQDGQQHTGFGFRSLVGRHAASTDHCPISFKA